MYYPTILTDRYCEFSNWYTWTTLWRGTLYDILSDSPGTRILVCRSVSGNIWRTPSNWGGYANNKDTLKLYSEHYWGKGAFPPYCSTLSYYVVVVQTLHVCVTHRVITLFKIFKCRVLRHVQCSTNNKNFLPHNMCAIIIVVQARNLVCRQSSLYFLLYRSIVPRVQYPRRDTDAFVLQRIVPVVFYYKRDFSPDGAFDFITLTKESVQSDFVSYELTFLCTFYAFQETTPFAYSSKFLLICNTQLVFKCSLPMQKPIASSIFCLTPIKRNTPPYVRFRPYAFIFFNTKVSL